MLDRNFGEDNFSVFVFAVIWIAVALLSPFSECNGATAALTHQGNATSYSLPVARWTIDPVKARELDTIRKRTYLTGQTVTNGVVIQHVTNGHKSWSLTNRVSFVRGSDASNRVSLVVERLREEAKTAQDSFWNQVRLTDSANRRAEASEALYAKATNSNAEVVNWLVNQRDNAKLSTTKALIQTFINKVEELQQADGR